MNQIFGLVEWYTWRLPLHLLTRQAWQFRRMLAAVTGNARALAGYNIFWTIPNAFLVVYLPLYEAERGLSKIEIGTITSAQVGVQMVGALLGGYLADRFGRLRTVLWVDIICWPAAYLCFAFADGYLAFLAGAILIGGVFTLTPAWSALYLQGSPANKRLQMFGILQMPWFLGAVISSLSFFVVKDLGVTETCRFVFAAASVSTLTGWYLRKRALVDPDPPRRPVRLSLREVRRIAEGHWDAFQALVQRRQMAYFFAIQVLFQAAAVTGATFTNLYLSDARGVQLNPDTLAILPLFGGVSNLIFTLIMVPLITTGGLYWFLGGGLMCMALNATLALLAPPGALNVILTGAVIGSGGFAVYNPAVSSVWSNLMDDRERPRILAFTTVTSMALTMPIPTIAGALYNVNCRGPLLTILWAYAMIALFVILAATRRKETARP